MLVYELFGFTARTATEDGGVFPTGGRTRFVGAIEVARISGSVTITIEANPTGDAAAWTQLYAITLTTTGETAISSIGGDTPDFTVTRRDRFLRARITALTGTVYLRVTLQAPWLDTVPEDSALLSAELRDYSELERLLRSAEDDVLAIVTKQVTVNQYLPGMGYPYGARAGWPRGWTDDVDQNPWTPLVVSAISPEAAEYASEKPSALVFDADMTLAGFGDAVRAAIARQAEHRFQRYKLEQRVTEPNVRQVLHGMGTLAAGVGSLLAPYRRAAAVVWRGR